MNLGRLLSQDVSDGAKALLVLLWRNAHEDGWGLISKTDLARTLRVTEKTVRNRRIELEQAGLIRSYRRFSEYSGAQLTSAYRVLLGAPDDDEELPPTLRPDRVPDREVRAYYDRIHTLREQKEMESGFQGRGKAVSIPSSQTPAPTHEPAHLDLALQKEREKETRGKEREKDDEQGLTLKEQVQLVFLAWMQATGKSSQTKLLAARHARILWALRHYPLEDVVAAVRGVARSPHHMGDNDRGERYDDITLVLRNETNLEKFRDIERGVVKPGRGASGRRYVPGKEPVRAPAPEPEWRQDPSREALEMSEQQAKAIIGELRRQGLVRPGSSLGIKHPGGLAPGSHTPGPEEAQEDPREDTPS